MKKIIASLSILIIIFAYGIFLKFSENKLTSIDTLKNSNSTNSKTPTTSASSESINPNSSNESGAATVSVNTPTSIPSSNMSSGKFKDGTYTGIAGNNIYGDVQVQAIIANGKLVDINFLRYPNDREHSMEISNYSLPRLKEEAISVQSANVDIVSGATDTSQAFIESLSSALQKAS